MKLEIFWSGLFSSMCENTHSWEKNNNVFNLIADLG